jgi:hypothetical protein
VVLPPLWDGSSAILVLCQAPEKNESARNADQSRTSRSQLIRPTSSFGFSLGPFQGTNESGGHTSRNRIRGSARGISGSAPGRDARQIVPEPRLPIRISDCLCEMVANPTENCPSRKCGRITHAGADRNRGHVRRAARSARPLVGPIQKFGQGIVGNDPFQ